MDYRKSGKVLVMIRSRSVLLFILILMALGCAALSSIQRIEPKVIVIRNSSNIDLKVVSLREAGKPALSPVRLGYVSPVPRGISQEVGRPSSPPPLPNTLEVAWTDRQGREYVKRVSMKQALNRQTGEGKDALVFEIRPSGIVNVFREEYRQLY